MIRLPRSLQGQLVALVLAVVLGVWCAVAAITWIDARHELDELLDGHLAQAAALLVAQQAGELSDDHHDRDLPALHRYSPKVAFQVFHEGRLVLRSANAPAKPMIAREKNFRSGFDTVTLDGDAWRVFAAYGAEQDVQVYVGEHAGSRIAILRAVLRSTLWPMALALPFLGLAIWWAVYSGIAPLRRLGSALASRRPDTLDPVAPGNTTTEIVPIVDALNDLFGRIHALLMSERRFTADAAHELRTPIAAIRAQAQVALAETDDALRSRALHHTLEGCDRAARLVEQLLMLSRMDANTVPSMENVDLTSLCRQVAGELAPRAIGKNQVLAFSGNTPCIIRGNEALLAALIRNLVDNAIRYSPDPAQVNVSVARHADKVVLKVEDSGPGMSEADIRKLGERFFRVLGTGENGSGLGWSIVRRIAAAHNLELQVGRSATLGGLAVSITGRALKGFDDQ
ncbi:ATP-binding protein [Noviherbaspirillum denitrificans]|uniref:histidine kinase n=1 Tax=Noviherbaspirillum denitrificans TaxID=1968433 RepID=A0A254T6F1_9BURK|nr:ATP-binding protein [Noviherbaspirillum denitrificans]OWW18244.1 histidine kinase [Noviherbaspirillum denitrificans]